MIILIICLIPANVLCVPSLVKNAKTAAKPAQLSMCPSTESDVKISKIRNDEVHFDDNRTRRNAPDIEPPIQWSYLRQYICGPTNSNCMRDERLRPDFLKKISKIASYDWASKGFPISKEHFADGNHFNSVNLSGRREGPLYVEEPNFVLVKEEPQSDLLDTFYRDDPFIPQRGRKSDNKSKLVNSFNGMLTPTPKDRNLLQNHPANTMTMTRQFEQSKKLASPIYDMCCQQGMYGSTGISKLCFVRCYSRGMKVDMEDIENYDYSMPQEVEII
ncbi:uncharacterized protein LOC119069782 isoform X2 [Bradysia coprophila]|uniref:uncharacterized protein LOC119069782 isoform X2 n=1 Tax=Bradysia coprophila TaxID=38358 RepID=UPI00187DB982|nr:uncharacterized protein LOC119069782 isoform X2 [Bradysia coprophila]